MVYFWPYKMSLENTIKGMLAIGKGLQVEKVELTNSQGLLTMGALLNLASNN